MRATDDPRFDDDEAFDEDVLSAMLGDPDVWLEPNADDADADADAIVGLIAGLTAQRDLADGDDAAAAPTAESGLFDDHSAGDGESAMTPVGSMHPVIDLSSSRERRADRRRGGIGPMLLSAAAGALFVVVAWAAVATLRPGETDGVELALEATDLAPGASGEATVVVGSLGTRIDLVVSGLEPAPPGFYYEAWLRESPEVGVSAGTFHLRGGDGEVELWAGVDPADYPLLTVTIQEEALSESSGRVVLRGRLDRE